MKIHDTKSDAQPAATGNALSWFAVWLALGAALGFSLIDLPAFGLLVLPFAVAGLVLAVVRHGLDRAAWGLVCGLGLLCLLVAYIQRRGPGVVTWHTATASGSATYLDPRPWLIAGLLFVLGGLGAFLCCQLRSA